MNFVSSIRKALVPVAVAGAIYILAYIGVADTPELRDQITLIVTAALVYFIPNE